MNTKPRIFDLEVSYVGQSAFVDISELPKGLESCYFTTAYLLLRKEGGGGGMWVIFGMGNSPKFMVA